VQPENGLHSGIGPAASSSVEYQFALSAIPCVIKNERIKALRSRPVGHALAAPRTGKPSKQPKQRNYALGPTLPVARKDEPRHQTALTAPSPFFLAERENTNIVSVIPMMKKKLHDGRCPNDITAGSVSSASLVFLRWLQKLTL